MEDNIGWLAAGLLLLGLIVQHDASAADPGPGAQQCASLARYALIARAFSEAKVGKQRAKSVLSRVYQTDPRGSQLAGLVLDYAYRDKSPAEAFSLQLESSCLENQREAGSAVDTEVPLKSRHRVWM